MKSVFLIKTPLQLLNAIEAKHYFGLSAAECVLIIMGDRKSQPQILALSDATDEWDKVVTLNDVNLFFGSPFDLEQASFLGKLLSSKFFKKSFFYVRRLNKLSRYLGEVNYIFVGYTRYIYMSHFINVTSHKKLVLLDDGNGTLELVKQRNQSFSTVSGISFKKKLKRNAKRFFQGVKDEEKNSACFFTVYDIKPGLNDKVLKNDFSYLRSNVGTLPDSDDVYFIGSPLSEVGIMSQTSYLDNLGKVKKYFSDSKLVYISHRRDSAEKLELIKSDIGIDVVSFEYPIEYQLAFIGPRPKILASFFSAALDSCRLIFSDKLTVISFRLDMTDSPKREKIESIYASYELIKSDNFIIESDF